jgi:hypothetical protein
MPAWDPAAAQSELFGMEQIQPAPGAAPEKKGFDRAKLMRLIPLVAAAAKGGPGAMEGLLQGYQQAAAQKAQQAQQQQQTDRQARMDDRLLQNDQFSQNLQTQQFAHTQDQLAFQQEKARADLAQEFGKALQDLDDPEAVRALTQMYEARGRALGVRPGTFEQTAMQVVKPSTLERRSAEKKVNALKGQFGVEKWMTEGAKFTHVVNGRSMSFGELLSAAGMVPDPNAAQAPGDDDFGVPGTAEYSIYLRGLISEFKAKNGRLPDESERVALMDRANAKTVAPQRTPISLQIGAGGVTPQQNATFQQIAGAYERSPLVRAADRTIVLDQAIKQIEKNPSDPAAQLNLAYSYIQALDTYQSAVREGELQNLGVLGTRLQQFALELNRVANEGAFLPPAVAKNIATNAKTLVSTIKAGSVAKRQEFRSRAQVSGVGEMWDQFVAGSQGGGAPGGRPAPAGANPFRK